MSIKVIAAFVTFTRRHIVWSRSIRVAFAAVIIALRYSCGATQQETTNIESPEKKVCIAYSQIGEPRKVVAK